ncbi:hypothetical protein DSO57_1037485, partial [Entomophthora muscae]
MALHFQFEAGFKSFKDLPSRPALYTLAFAISNSPITSQHEFSVPDFEFAVQGICENSTPGITVACEKPGVRATLSSQKKSLEAFDFNRRCSKYNTSDISISNCDGAIS